MDVPMAHKNAGLQQAHHQRCMMFPRRGQIIPIMNAFDLPVEHTRSRRNEGMVAIHAVAKLPGLPTKILADTILIAAGGRHLAYNIQIKKRLCLIGAGETRTILSRSPRTMKSRRVESRSIDNDAVCLLLL
ncbi:hypothetical protein ACFX1S_032241 [Malus domestica]